MIKNISNDVAREVKTSRDEFMSAFVDVENICVEIKKHKDRLEKIEVKILERFKMVAEMRVKTAESLDAYKKEQSRIAIENEAIANAKHNRSIAAEAHAEWELLLRNARTRREGSNEIDKIIKSEPAKPDSIMIPVLSPIDSKIESCGLVAIQDLAFAMSEYALAIAERIECKETLLKLSDELEGKEDTMIECRNSFEKDIAKVDRDFKARALAAKTQRENEIKNLRQMRDAAIKGLQAMGEM